MTPHSSKKGHDSLLGSPGRREVGHGNLAERALRAALPGEDEFPYVIRTESLITESCGSSSMASVCAGALSMRAAGVPLKSLVAGVAMGRAPPCEIWARYGRDMGEIWGDMGRYGASASLPCAPPRRQLPVVV